MVVLSKLAVGGSTTAVVVAMGSLWLRKQRSQGDSGTGSEDGEVVKPRSAKPTDVNREFFQRLGRLLRVVVPGWTSKEAMLLGLLSGFLVIRTFLSIRVSVVNGAIVEAIVRRDLKLFLTRLLILASISIPASTVNSLLKFLGNKLSLRFRQRLVDKFHNEYLEGMRYYEVSNVDSRISNPDQALTETIRCWGCSLADLYSNISKPLFDIVLFSAKLSALVGIQGPGIVILYYVVSGIIMRLVSPQFGKLTEISQKLEGVFRYYHNRIIAFSEEIAFYNGNGREKQIVNEKFDEIVTHYNSLYWKQFLMGIFDGFLSKYGAVMLGYGVLGLPVFGPSSQKYALEIGADTSLITRDYIRNSSLLINLAQAIGRIVTSYKELQKLAGYTTLVSELEQVLSDLKEGTYVRELVNPHVLEARGLKPHSGMIEESTAIEFENIPIVTPNGDILVEDVSFRIYPGSNLMVVGPNGSGKSSLFRILGQLWPLFGGTLKKPAARDIFYIPQKPYLAAGTLRDQIIYPHSHFEMKGSDEDLFKLLGDVKLQYLVEREGGWDTVREWADVLSGGEKQRIAMARLFYHRPRFAILDECTSAVSVDVEGFMYTHCKELGISLITVSHRPSLWKYHELKLEFDGRGGWSYGKMILPQNFNHIP